MLIVACVTSGFVAPGVQARSGKPLRLTHEFGGRTGLAGGVTIQKPIPHPREPRPRPWDGAPFYVLTGVTFSRRCRAAASTASADVVSMSGCTPTPLYISPLGPVTC